MIAAFDLASVSSDPVVNMDALVLGQGWNLRDFVQKPSGGEISINAGGAAGFGISAEVSPLGADFRSIVSLITCVPDGLGNNVLKLYVDGVYKSQVTLPYVSSGNPMRMGTPNVLGKNPLVHGWVGGNSLLTNSEIKQWFISSRYNLEIAEIPGKTSDRITATSVAPLAPATLPNLAGGQSMDYVVNVLPDPVVRNVLVPVTFAY